MTTFRKGDRVRVTFYGKEHKLIVPTVTLSAGQLIEALDDAKTAHTEYEKQTGKPDADWQAWYAGYIVQKYSKPEAERCPICGEDYSRNGSKCNLQECINDPPRGRAIVPPLFGAQSDPRDAALEAESETIIP